MIKPQKELKTLRWKNDNAILKNKNKFTYDTSVNKMFKLYDPEFFFTRFNFQFQSKTIIIGTHVIERFYRLSILAIIQKDKGIIFWND